MKRKALLVTAMAALIATGIATFDAAQAGNWSGQRGARMFDRHDTDGDGKITQEEFTARCADRFAAIDGDGNGEVTRAEAQEAFEQMRAKHKGMGRGGPGAGQGPKSGQQ